MPNTMFEKSEEQNGSLSVSDLDFEKFSGLLPVIAQEHGSGRVLMLAYANLEAVRKTQETGYAHYWSRSRNTLWKKGESSGHVQQITGVLVDCDEDTLIYKVSQKGPACHTGAKSCFFRELHTKPRSK